MSDIIERLRERSTAWPEDGAIRSLLIEAAVEIERHRKRCADLVSLLEDGDDLVARLDVPVAPFGEMRDLCRRTTRWREDVRRALEAME